MKPGKYRVTVHMPHWKEPKVLEAVYTEKGKKGHWNLIDDVVKHIRKVEKL